MEPEAILEHRERPLRSRYIHEVLVKWKFYPEEDASWEDWNRLILKFPFLSR